MKRPPEGPDRWPSARDALPFNDTANNPDFKLGGTRLERGIAFVDGSPHHDRQVEGALAVIRSVDVSVTKRSCSWKMGRGHRLAMTVIEAEAEMKRRRRH
jgi:hypothetical protein